MTRRFFEVDMLFANHLETFLIVGLGNPGPEYAHTRHNCGFEVIQRLSGHFSAPLTRTRCKGLIAEIKQDSRRIVLCQPQTFMNASGECVAPLLHWYHCPTDHLLVIYDDIDLPEGTLRLRKSGSAGTHNGMRSILAQLPDGNFPRLRIGVGAPPHGSDLIPWVLGHFRTPEETAFMQETFARASDTVLDALDHGLDHAMQLCNRKATSTSLTKENP